MLQRRVKNNSRKGEKKKYASAATRLRNGCDYAQLLGERFHRDRGMACLMEKVCAKKETEIGRKMDIWRETKWPRKNHDG